MKMARTEQSRTGEERRQDDLEISRLTECEVLPSGEERDWLLSSASTPSGMRDGPDSSDFYGDRDLGKGM